MNDWLARLPAWPWIDPAHIDPQWVEATGWFFIGYFVLLTLLYLVLNLIALRLIGREAANNEIGALADYSAGLEPGISILVPAYNESATIAAAVRSMLQLDYPDYEVIVCNDGSKDDTLEVLKREFALQPFPEAYRRALPVAEVHGLWRSPRHPQLIVIDKVNGGRSDAVNAAVNAAHHGLVCVVDADSVLQRDSLKRVVRPFMEDRRVVASGGTVRLSNGCRIAQGHLQDVAVPRNWVARIQVVEYLRGFLYGRLGWAPMNALLIISGAFGVFRRAVLIEAGGLSTRTIGEDMELTMRLHRIHRLSGRDYRIAFVPDANCWTEAPETLAVLRSQRVRWHRGLLECLWTHRRLALNPRAGAVGWLAYPFMFLFEAIAPLVEALGYIVITVLALSGLISWPTFWVFLLLAFGAGLMMSANALLLEELAFHTYQRPRHLLQLLAAIVVENFGYRQLNTWWRLVGIWQWATGRKQVWGEMKRRGSGDGATA
ncbi:MAG TPA: glycosyltransferase family 2 protein [Methylibium sp.]|nr:glycosyltransferase family 2 protein [Methylibium sp.]